jgi:hypothetical protein
MDAKTALKGFLVRVLLQVYEDGSPAIRQSVLKYLRKVRAAKL